MQKTYADPKLEIYTGPFECLAGITKRFDCEEKAVTETDAAEMNRGMDRKTTHIEVVFVSKIADICRVLFG